MPQKNYYIAIKDFTFFDALQKNVISDELIQSATQNGYDFLLFNKDDIFTQEPLIKKQLNYRGFFYFKNAKDKKGYISSQYVVEIDSKRKNAKEKEKQLKPPVISAIVPPTIFKANADIPKLGILNYKKGDSFTIDEIHNIFSSAQNDFYYGKIKKQEYGFIPKSAVEPIYQALPNSAVKPINQELPNSAVEPIHQELPKSAVKPINQELPNSAVEPIYQALPNSVVYPIYQKLPNNHIGNPFYNI